MMLQISVQQVKILYSLLIFLSRYIFLSTINIKLPEIRKSAWQAIHSLFLIIYPSIYSVKRHPSLLTRVSVYSISFRIEDLTDAEERRQNPKCDRIVSFYGYVRGANVKPGSKIHLLGTKYRLSYKHLTWIF